jgi:hypothetical protein
MLPMKAAQQTKIAASPGGTICYLISIRLSVN